ncbi:murein biosynthesis integral membrane protein MurJ [Carbonactinospora thermoautotrophica]|nr:murein biosynthesis integral membrane protein MurJ [Carbonactinospora thermoautotrophica]KWW98401.1 putative transmembrane protein [Carbonactinospora thermoautotrophica]MCX9192029.1 murein biosynthesis integral membrane protein MurJ [Carbonactinospora thermoautotrophica]
MTDTGTEHQDLAGEERVAQTAEGRRHSLLKSSAIMALGTIVSRLTGFLRNILLVTALGTGILADTYNVANTLPNIVYALLVGGTLNAVFVPQIVRAMKENEDGGEAYVNRLLTLTGVVLLGITVVTVLAAPLIIALYAGKYTTPGFEQDFDHAVTFARYCLPQMFFYGLYVMLGQVLNARDRFGAMMWTPILNNVVVITTFGLFIWVSARGDLRQTITPEELRLLGVGTTLGIVVQALSLVPFVTATGFRLRPRFDWRGVGLGKAAGLAKWMLLLVLANQIGYWMVVKVATTAEAIAQEQRLGVGVGLTPYQNASLLFQLPHSIITVSIMTALMPRLSRAVADGRLDEVRDDLSDSLRTAAVAIVPAAFAFLALGPSITGMMYAPVGPEDARYIGYVLMGFAVGLIPFSAHHLVIRSFYAFEDTRTPFWICVWINAANVIGALLSLVLLPTQWITVGLAVSYSVSYTIGLIQSTRLLRRRIGGLDGPRVIRTYARLCVAGAVAAVCAFAVAQLATRIAGDGLAGSALAVVAGGLVLLGVYVLAAQRMRVAELDSMIGMVRARIGR